MPEPTWYTEIFLTTRNGLFFALPMMCIGGFIENHQVLQQWRKFKDSMLIVIAFVVFCIEVFVCRKQIPTEADCSMYLSLPFITMMTVRFFMSHLQAPHNHVFSNIQFDKWSSAVYLLQFGVISVGMSALNKTGLQDDICTIVVYLTLILGALAFSNCIKGNESVQVHILITGVPNIPDTENRFATTPLSSMFASLMGGY